ncbi:MAG: hypothetical protein NT138_23950 [Planctomycetales bacterium]|jgi:hypothetical protein|nr:hypothetical protein [Planctomycetales bacterium]
MRSRTIKQLFAAASVGSIILVSAMPVNAGRMFKDEPSRPHTFAGCQPAWGYNQTCWQRFPALPPCDSNGNCYGQPSDGATSYDHSGSVYAPQHHEAVVDPSFSGVPQTQPGPNSHQMFVPNHGTANSSTELRNGTPMGNPTIQAPLHQYSSPPQTQTLDSLVPSVDQPSQQVPPAPSGSLALPPLPAPPDAIPATPGQTRFQPQYEQLMPGPDGRLNTSTAMNRNQGYSSGASRYGQINRPVSSQQIPTPSMPRRTGPPVQFADAVTSLGNQQNHRSTHTVGTADRPASSRNNNPSGTLARPVSQSHNMLPANSSRYGVTRPAADVSTAPAIVVEPLRKTPGSYR